MNMPNRASRHHAVRWAASGSETSRAHWAFSNWTPNKKTHIKRIFPRRQSKDIRMFTSMTGVVGPAGDVAQFEAEGGVTSGSAAEEASPASVSDRSASIADRRN